jgi:hypothetical protein
MLVITQKSGIVYGLNPDRDGEVLWRTQVGDGGQLGGNQWGSAADHDTVYVAVPDLKFIVNLDGKSMALQADLVAEEGARFGSPPGKKSGRPGPPLVEAAITAARLSRPQSPRFRE